jgi:hypothetical protein
MSCPKFFESIIKSLDICTFSLQAALHIWTKCGPSGLHLYRIVSLTGAVKNVSALLKTCWYWLLCGGVSLFFCVEGIFWEMGGKPILLEATRICCKEETEAPF